MGTRTNRRQLLKSGALATAGAGGLLVGAKPAEAQLPLVDVCVVGGGMAGLTAAYRLRQARRSVMVLEAAPRLGGRTFTGRVSDGTPFEIGGAWVSGTETQSNILQLMTELGIGMFRQWVDGDAIFNNADNQASRWNQAEDPPPISLEAVVNLAQANEKISLMADTIDLEEPWKNVEFPFLVEPGDLTGPATSVEADQMSLKTWFDNEMGNDPDSVDGRTLITAAIDGLTGMDPPALSLLQILFLIKSFGSIDGQPPTLLNVTGTDVGQANAFRLPQGMQSISSALIKRIGQKNCITNSPVRQIDQMPNSVIVTSDRMTVRARQVIVALATTNQGLIRFQPILPPDRAQLRQRYPLGLIWKCWLLYDEAFWRTNGLSGSTVSIAPDDFFGASLDGGPAPEQTHPGLLVSFVDGDKGREFNKLTRAQRKQRMIDEFAHRFEAVALGNQARNLSPTLRFPVVTPQNPVADNYFEFNWVLDEFTRGDYGGTPGPGVLTAVGFGPAIRESFGRVHWAGVDTSTECYGTINSAIQSGNIAAARALAGL